VFILNCLIYFLLLKLGYSVLYAVIEELLGTPLSSISLPTAKKVRETPSLINKLIFGAALPFKIFYDLSHFFALAFSQPTSWHVQDDRKHWKQFYAKSQPIPIQTIKTIKDRLGVSFTAVLFSAVSAGISRNLNANLQKNTFIKSISSCTAMPLRNHPKKMRNHM